MIKDKLVNAETYFNTTTHLKKGFEWLLNNDLNTINPQKYVIDRDKIFANVQEYETKVDAKYETHQKYIDIQYMIKGKELVGVCEKSDCETYTEYDKSTDLEFMTCKTKEHYEELNEGEFLVFFPQDAHKPSIMSEIPHTVKKVIVKIAID